MIVILSNCVHLLVNVSDSIVNMFQQLTGIVLNTVRYSDTNNIVEIYTREQGRLSFLLPLARGRKAAVKSVFFQSLSMIELVADIRPKASLHRIREVKQWYICSSLPYDPVKTSISLFLAEFLGKVLREVGGNTVLFDYLAYSIQWLDSCRESFANFHLVFLIRFSRFLGLYPNVDGYCEGDYFDLLNGCYAPARPQHAYFLTQEEAAVLHQLVRANFYTMHLFALNRGERNRCLEQILLYYRLHVPAFPELKSLSVLQELFS